MFLKKIFLLVLILAASMLPTYAVQTYMVTSTADPTGTPVAGTLRYAITQAKSYITSNSGATVDIIFDAPGLCQIVTLLPTLQISSGAINLKKSLTTSIEQGISFNGSTSDNAFVNLLSIINTSSSSLSITGISFKNYIPSTGASGACIILSGAYNISIEDCLFSNNARTNISLGANSVDNVTISNNTFDLSMATSGLSYLYGIATTTPATVTNTIISDNYFYNTTDLTTVTTFLPTALYIFWDGTMMSKFLNVIIEGNTFKNLKNGQWIFNFGQTPAYLSTNILSNIKIRKNTYENCHLGIYYRNPYRTFVNIENNIFQNNRTDIYLYHNAGAPFATINPYKCGIDFIEQNNPFGYTPVNYGNDFTHHTNTSFPQIVSVGVYFYVGAGISFIGTKLSGKIVVSGFGTSAEYEGKTLLRGIQNKVHTSELPIDLASYSPSYPTGSSGSAIGHGNIASPTLQKTTIYSGKLRVQFELTGSQIYSSYGDYVLDFYKSDANGSLLDYIGNTRITSITGSSYTVDINIPNNVVLNNGERIAATVFADMNQSHPNTNSINVFKDFFIGTSEAAYATIDDVVCPTCTSVSINAPTSICKDREVVFDIDAVDCFASPTFTWNFGDGSSVSSSPQHTYAAAGTYTVTASMTLPGGGSCAAQNFTKSITVTTCTDEIECPNCIGSFSPEPGTYVLSAWVKEESAASTKTSYTNPQIVVEFPSITTTLSAFTPKGAIIDGWQRIEEEFTIPSTATNIKLNLQSTSGTSYFDDVRVYPVNGSMKSMVYDPVTMRLVAELDERNYATIYNYDEEGKRTRVKKETERGIMTIQETKQSKRKITQ